MTGGPEAVYYRRLVCVLLIWLQVSGPVVAATLISHNRHTSPQPLELSPGDQAPAFTLPDVDYVPLSLDELRQEENRDLLLVFGDVHSSHTMSKIALLNEVTCDSGPDGFKVVFIAVGNSHADVQKYIEENDIKFQVLVDINYNAAWSYGVRGFPEPFIIDQDGLVEFSGLKDGHFVWTLLFDQYGYKIESGDLAPYLQDYIIYEVDDNGNMSLRNEDSKVGDDSKDLKSLSATSNSLRITPHDNVDNIVLSDHSKVDLDVDFRFAEVYGSSSQAKDQKINIDTGTNIGQLAPDFRLSDIDGSQVTLSELRDEDILLVFGNTECPHCTAKVPLLNELEEDGWKILFIVLGDNRDAVGRYIEDNNVCFQMLLDPDRSVGIRYNINRIPELYHIDQDMRIVMGGPQESPALWAALSGQEIPEIFTENRVENCWNIPHSTAATSEQVEKTSPYNSKIKNQLALKKWTLKERDRYFKSTGPEYYIPAPVALQLAAKVDLNDVILEEIDTEELANAEGVIAWEEIQERQDDAWEKGKHSIKSGFKEKHGLKNGWFKDNNGKGKAWGKSKDSKMSAFAKKEDLEGFIHPAASAITLPEGTETKSSPRRSIDKSEDDPECTSTPTGDCEVTQNLDITPGHYILTGTMDFQADNLYIDCHGATLEYPESYALIYGKYFSNLTVRNCILQPQGIAMSFKSPDFPGTPTNTGDIYLYNNTVYGYSGVYMENMTNVHIDGLDLVNLSSTYYGIRVWECDGVVIDDLYSQAYKGNDIQLIWSNNVTVRNSEFLDFWRFSAIFGYNTTHSLIEGNKIYQTVPSTLRTFTSSSREVIIDGIPPEWYNNPSNDYKFNHSVGIWLESNCLDFDIHNNKIWNLGSVGIFITETRDANLSYNYIYDIADTFDYQPWPNYPDAIELDDSLGFYVGYNTLTKAKRYGLTMWNMANVTFEYNDISNNNYMSNDSYPDFHLYNSPCRFIDKATGLCRSDSEYCLADPIPSDCEDIRGNTYFVLKYNNFITDGEEWPYIRGNPVGKYMIEDSLWNRNQNVTWNGEYYVPGPFSPLDLLTTNHGAIDGTLNYWGSTDPSDCSGSCTIEERKAIPERMEDWEDHHGWGKTYFSSCYNSTTMELIDSWKCNKTNSHDDNYYYADTDYDDDGTHGGYLSKAVDIYCQKDLDGDGAVVEHMPIRPEFRCHPEAPFYNTRVDCDDSDPDNFPGNIEVCDDQDNDCDGLVDNLIAIGSNLITEKQEYIEGELASLDPVLGEVTNVTFSVGMNYKECSGGCPGLDVVWVIDESGSMSDDKQEVIDNAELFFNNFIDGGIDFRVAVTLFGGTQAATNYPVNVDGSVGTTLSGTGEWTTNLSEFQTMVNAMKLDGGTELGLEALSDTVDHYTFRDDIIKYFIIVSDEDADDDSPTWRPTVINKLNSNDITVSAVSGVAPEYSNQDGVAYSTGGEWYNIGGNWSNLMVYIYEHFLSLGGKWGYTQPYNATDLDINWAQQNQSPREYIEEDIANNPNTSFPADLFTNPDNEYFQYSITVERADYRREDVKENVLYKFDNDTLDPGLDGSDIASVEYSDIYLKSPYSYSNSYLYNNGSSLFKFYLYLGIDYFNGTGFVEDTVIVDNSVLTEIDPGEHYDLLPEWNLFNTSGKQEGMYRAVLRTYCYENPPTASYNFTILADSDGDGISDYMDNCPNDYNPDQNNSDIDNWGDVCDNCWYIDNQDQLDFDLDCPAMPYASDPYCGDVCDPYPNDFDNDGLNDSVDNCPQIYNPDQNNSDFDTLGDICDNCPFVNNLDQNDMDSDGKGDECDCLPDLSNNNIVNSEDFGIFALYWREIGCTAPDFCSACDFDKSTAVGIEDLLMMAEYWLSDCYSGSK